MGLDPSIVTVTDDDGTGAVGSIINVAWWTTVLNMINGRWSIRTTNATGTQNNFTLVSGGIEADVLQCTNTSDLDITGIAAPASPAKAGKEIIVIATGTGNVYLHQTNASSSASNWLYNKATTAKTAIKAGSGGYGYARYMYNGAGWVMTGHDQGGYIQTTFSAGNFDGNGSMTWTLASGDRPAGATGYYLQGNNMKYYFQLATTTVGGTPNTQLRIGNGEWGGFTAAFTAQYRRLAFILDNSASVEAYIVPASTRLTILKNNGANWAAATDATYVYGDCEFAVA